jgi:O-antigen/teichoic acid export membrane protein
MEHRTLKEKAVHGIVWYGGSRVVIQLLSWVLTIAVARILLPEDYGLFGMASVYTGLVDCLNELGFGAAIVQRKEIDEDDLHTLFWFGMAVSLLIYAITYLVAPLVAVFYRHEQVTEVLRVLGLVFILTNLRLVPWNLLTRVVDFKRRSIVEIISNMVSVVSTFLLARAGCGVWSLVLGVLIREVLLTAIVYTQSHWRLRFRFAWASLRESLSFSLDLSGARIAWYMYDNSDRLVIGRYLGDQTLGYYTLATRLTTDLSGRVLSIINQVAFPVYSRLQDDHERLKNYYLMSVQLVAVSLIPVLSGLSLVSSEAVAILLKPRWLPMVPALTVMCWAAIFITLEAFAWPILVAKGETRLNMRFCLVRLAVLPVSFYTATRFGLIGVCLVWVTVFPILSLTWLNAVGRVVGYTWAEMGKMLLPAITATVAMMTAVLMVDLAGRHFVSPPLLLAAKIIGGASVYGSVLWFCFPSVGKNCLRLVKHFRKGDADGPRPV